MKLKRATERARARGLSRPSKAAKTLRGRLVGVKDDLAADNAARDDADERASAAQSLAAQKQQAATERATASAAIAADLNAAMSALRAAVVATETALGEQPGKPALAVVPATRRAE